MAALMRPVLWLCLVTRAWCNHYATLGVGRKAAAPEIKRAFRSLALKYHPDKFLDPAEKEEASERFKAVTEAFEVLRDPAKRRMYDLQQSLPEGMRSGQPGSPFGTGADRWHGGTAADRFSAFGDFGPSFPPDFFSMPGIFGGLANGPVEPLPPAQRVLGVTLRELQSGGSRTVTLKDSPVSRLRDALDASWRGEAGRALERTLYVAASILWRFPGLILRGGGRWFRLPLLAGAFATALVRQLPPSPSGTFNIDVRPGWRQGTKLEFETGHGAACDDAASRGVVFVIRELRHPRLERSRNNLVHRTSASRRAAASGTTLSVPTLSGALIELALKLHPHELAAGTVKRTLDGLGMPIDGGPARGDLIAVVSLVGPVARDAHHAEDGDGEPAASRKRRRRAAARGRERARASRVRELGPNGPI